MLEWGCQVENARVSRLGVASHNLFDVALALVLRREMGVESRVEIEMLEGMAPHQARVVRAEAGGLLLYAPVVKRTDFLSALAYLIRRLDENTSKDNFLRDAFGLTLGGAAWHEQRAAFEAGWRARHAVLAGSRRQMPATDATQTTDATDADEVPVGEFERAALEGEPVESPSPENLPFNSESDESLNGEPFHNEPDSDWTQIALREALKRALDGWQDAELPALPALETVLETARCEQVGWENRGIAARAAVLRRAAREMARGRFETIACMRGEAKKAVPESDAEVSEAIDFARYYARHTVPDGVEARALGVVVVTPPWNFPYAIPCGGVLAALMAGNAVILKPAPETAQTAYLLARQLWRAGVPREVLQFFACDDGETGQALICDARVGAVILTGSLETARMFQGWRPSLRLLAETSGKNALVITAQADREAAIKDVVKSAFGHAGQKCSAASLAIVESEVYDSPDFRRQLRDCARSLAVGPASDLRAVVTPTTPSPSPALLRALTTLDEGETWLLEPQPSGEDSCAWSPGIKIGVKTGSWFHQTECFGPVLGVMRATSLKHALELQNATRFGLTAGLHSLDPREIAAWIEGVEAGNLYINRGTTGAVVQRQPFGGWKASSIGAGAKAGGPNYVWSLMHLRDAPSADAPSVDAPSVDAPSALAAEVSPRAATDFAASYREARETHFSRAHDPSGLGSESNIFRYRACRGVILRLPTRDLELVRRAELAAQLTGAALLISTADEETDADFAARLPQLAPRFERVRTPAGTSDAVLRAAHGAGLNWIEAPLSGHGRVELRFWLREQAVSQTRHRYGQVSEFQPTSRRGLSASPAESS